MLMRYTLTFLGKACHLADGCDAEHFLHIPCQTQFWRRLFSNSRAGYWPILFILMTRRDFLSGTYLQPNLQVFLQPTHVVKEVWLDSLALSSSKLETSLGN